MADPYDENLFEDTRMTFGQHLEELRRAFIKAFAALFVGFLVGLLFAGSLVDYVQTPLRSALMNYYRGVSADEYRQTLQERQAAGQPVPEDFQHAADEFAKEGLVVELQYVDPREALDAVDSVLPNVVDPTVIPQRDPTQPPRRDNLVPLRTYRPLEDDPRMRVIGLNVQEPFVVYMKAAVVLAIILSSPLVFHFIWQFVAAGLYPHERRYVHIFLPVSLGLFLAGVMLAFFFVFQYVLAFLFHFFAWMGIDPDPRITDWLSFVLILPLGFGIAFQLPLVMLFLERIGIFSVAAYMRQWRVAVLVICVLSMLLTPADPQSMILMAVPLIALYFGGVLLCRFMPARQTP